MTLVGSQRKLKLARTVEKSQRVSSVQPSHCLHMLRMYTRAYRKYSVFTLYGGGEKRKVAPSPTAAGTRLHDVVHGFLQGYS
jgi:hypothetical protein